MAAHAATSTPGILNGTGVGSGAWDGEYSVQSGPGFLYAAPLPDSLLLRGTSSCVIARVACEPRKF